MKRISIVLLSVLLLVGAVFAARPEYIVKNYPNGQKKYEGYFQNGKPVKELKRYHENGKLASVQVFDSKGGGSSIEIFSGEGKLIGKGRYVDGKRSGEWLFYSDSVVIMREFYVNGEQQGEATGYDLNGNITDRMYYRNGLRDSVRYQYFANGMLMARMYYKDGELEGEYNSYVYDGTPDVQGMYVSGKREGWWKFYSDNGVDSVRYENGKVFATDAMLDKISEGADARSNETDPASYVDDPEGFMMQVIH